jgi:hypothetical protein
MAIVQEHDLSLARSQRLRSPLVGGRGLPERAIEQLPASQLIKRGVGDYLTPGRDGGGMVSTIRSAAAGRMCGDALSVIGQMLRAKFAET